MSDSLQSLRMLSALQLRFAVFLAAYCLAQDGISAHRQDGIRPPTSTNPRIDHGFGMKARCGWNCTVIETDFAPERKAVIFKDRLINLVVKFELKLVDKECANQASRLSSSGNLTETCQVRLLANKALPSFAYRIENVTNLLFPTNSEECNEIRALCTLKSGRTTVSNDSDTFSLRFAQGHLTDLGVEFDSMKCNAEMKDTLYPCINISKSTGNNTESMRWPTNFVVFLGVVFVVVFIQYSLAFLCLFSPTVVVTKNGLRQIVLEGASPVSLRGLMGNYFFSGNETIWQNARMLIFRLVVLPLPYIAPAIIVDYLQNQNVIPRSKLFTFETGLFQPFMIVCYGFYFIQAFYVSFFGVTQEAKPCRVCQQLKVNIICNDKLPERIKNHLRLQPLILVECWKVLTRSLVKYFKMSLMVLPRTYTISFECLLHLLLFVISLALIPAVIFMLLLAGVMLALIGIFITSPVVRLCSATENRENNGFLNSVRPLFVFLRIFVTTPAIIGAMFVLFDAALGYFMAIITALRVLLCEECLPFLACGVLVLYYLWSCYSSFTDQYQDLAISLYKCYRESWHLQFFDEEELATDSRQESKSNPDKNVNVVKIPKELFDMACEELMPIREGVCKLVLKVILILCFVFLVFSMIMLFDVGSTPVTKALLTFFTGSFPKIATIYFNGGRQKKLEALVTDEKAPIILQDYLNRQGQDNCEADIVEMILANESEENIEMVNMQCGD